MKKSRVIWIVVILLLLCAVGAGLMATRSGGRDQGTAVAYAKAAWADSGRSDLPASISYMHYTSTDSLNTIMAQPDISVALVPMSGYACFFPPTGSGDEAFSGLQLVFVGENGKVLSRMSYDDLYDTFQASGVPAYLDAANYMAALYLDSLKNSTPAGKDERIGCWYAFSADQIAAIVKK